jgi:hypothetical protein
MDPEHCSRLLLDTVGLQFLYKVHVLSYKSFIFHSGSDGGAILTARHVLYSCLDGALRYDLFYLKELTLLGRTGYMNFRKSSLR